MTTRERLRKHTGGCETCCRFEDGEDVECPERSRLLDRIAGEDADGNADLEDWRNER